jgi:NTE family protein
MQSKWLRRACNALLLVLLLPLSNLYAQVLPAQADALPQSARPRVGLALSGGGALGLAHIGVLKYLEEHHVPVRVVAGTSMGGLIGGLYASGHSPAEIEEVALHVNWDDLFRSTPRYEDLPVVEKQQWNRVGGEYTFRFGKRLALPAGINPGQQLALLLSRETLAYSDLSSFDDLPIPFRCVSTDLVSGEAYLLDRGVLPKALRATMAIPAIFTPVDWNGHILIDGGLVNNLPTDVVRQMKADEVIAVSVQSAPIKRTELNTITNILRQSVNIAVLQNERRNLKLADISIVVPLGDVNSLDFEKAKAIIASGYRAAQQNAAALQALELPDAEWREYVRDRDSRVRRAPDSGQLVAINSPQAPIQESGRHELLRKTGDSTSEHELEHNLTGLAAATGLPSAFFSWQRPPAREGFRVDLEPRTNNELLVRPAFFYQLSDGEPSRFTLRLDGTGIPQDAYKSRYLADLSIGYDPGARFEYYHTFDGNSDFIAPGLQVQRTHVLTDVGPLRNDDTRDRFAGSLYFGLGTWRSLQVRVGATGGFDKYSNVVTVDNVTATNTPFVNPGAMLIVNTEDSGQLPSRGTRMNGSLGWSFREHSYPYLQADFDSFQPAGKSFSLFEAANADTSFGRKLTLYDQFIAGGLTSLDAYHYQAFHANTLGTAGAGMIYRGLNPHGFWFRPFFAGWYEAGRLDLGSQGWRTAQSTSLAVLTPTPAGLTGLTISFDERGRARVRLSLGSFWNRP